MSGVCAVLTATSLLLLLLLVPSTQGYYSWTSPSTDVQSQQLDSVPLELQVEQPDGSIPRKMQVALGDDTDEFYGGVAIDFDRMSFEDTNDCVFEDLRFDQTASGNTLITSVTDSTWADCLLKCYRDSSCDGISFVKSGSNENKCELYMVDTANEPDQSNTDYDSVKLFCYYGFEDVVVSSSIDLDMDNDNKYIQVLTQTSLCDESTETCDNSFTVEFEEADYSYVEIDLSYDPPTYTISGCGVTDEDISNVPTEDYRVWMLKVDRNTNKNVEIWCNGLLLVNYSMYRSSSDECITNQWDNDDDAKTNILFTKTGLTDLYYKLQDSISGSTGIFYFSLFRLALSGFSCDKDDLDNCSKEPCTMTSNLVVDIPDHDTIGDDEFTLFTTSDGLGLMRNTETIVKMDYSSILSGDSDCLSNFKDKTFTQFKFMNDDDDYLYTTTTVTKWRPYDTRFDTIPVVTTATDGSNIDPSTTTVTITCDAKSNPMPYQVYWEDDQHMYGHMVIANSTGYLSHKGGIKLTDVSQKYQGSTAISVTFTTVDSVIRVYTAITMPSVSTQEIEEINLYVYFYDSSSSIDNYVKFSYAATGGTATHSVTLYDSTFSEVTDCASVGVFGTFLNDGFPSYMYFSNSSSVTDTFVNLLSGETACLAAYNAARVNWYYAKIGFAFELGSTATASDYSAAVYWEPSGFTYNTNEDTVEVQYRYIVANIDDSYAAHPITCKAAATIPGLAFDNVTAESTVTLQRYENPSVDLTSSGIASTTYTDLYNTAYITCTATATPVPDYMLLTQFGQEVVRKGSADFECVESTNSEGSGVLTCVYRISQLRYANCWDEAAGSTLGRDTYRGNKTTDLDGNVCQSWSSQTPNSHSFEPDDYPTKDLTENYCRNPDGLIGPWCYNSGGTDPRWQYCGIFPCTEDSYGYYECTTKSYNTAGERNSATDDETFAISDAALTMLVDGWYGGSDKQVRYGQGNITQTIKISGIVMGFTVTVNNVALGKDWYSCKQILDNEMNCTVVINTDSMDNEGTYVFTASAMSSSNNVAKTRSLKIVRAVEVKMELVQDSGSVTITNGKTLKLTEGSTFTLSCTVTSSNSNPQHIQMYTGTDSTDSSTTMVSYSDGDSTTPSTVTVDGYTYKAQLEIDLSSRGSLTQFNCLGENSDAITVQDGTATTYFYMQQVYNVTISSFTASGTSSYSEGQVATLSCNALGTYPTPSYLGVYFDKDGDGVLMEDELLVDTATVSTDDGDRYCDNLDLNETSVTCVYTISSTVFDHGGSYQCVAKNTVLDDIEAVVTEEVTVIVEGLTSASANPTSVEVSYGNDAVMLTYTVRSNPAATDIQLAHSSLSSNLQQSDDTDEYISTTTTLECNKTGSYVTTCSYPITFKDDSYTSSGDWTWSSQSDSTVVNVVINREEFGTFTYASTDLTYGETLTLTCTVSGHPTPTPSEIKVYADGLVNIACTRGSTSGTGCSDTTWDTAYAQQVVNDLSITYSVHQEKFTCSGNNDDYADSVTFKVWKDIEVGITTSTMSSGGTAITCKAEAGASPQYMEVRQNGVALRTSEDLGFCITDTSALVSTYGVDSGKEDNTMLCIYEIDDPNYSSYGIYDCVSWHYNVDGEKKWENAQTTLFSTLAVDISTLPNTSELEVMYGSTVTLVAYAVGHSNVYEVSLQDVSGTTHTWSRYGTSIGLVCEGDFKVRCEYVLHAVSFDEEGDYTWTATNNDGSETTDTATVSIVIIKDLEATIELVRTSSDSANENEYGASMTISCTVSGGRTPSKISFWRGDSDGNQDLTFTYPTSSGRKKRLTSGLTTGDHSYTYVYIDDSTDYDDGGTFYCKGEHEGLNSETETKTSETVVEIVKTVTMAATHSKNGNTLTITCTTDGGREPHWVQLEKEDGYYLTSTDDTSFCSSTATNYLSCEYVISNTVMADSGLYYCFAHNIGKNGIEYRASDTTQVDIATDVDVQIIPTSETEHLMENPLTITCYVTGYYEPSKVSLVTPAYGTITWRSSDTELGEMLCSGEYTKTCTYTIHTPSFGDEGTYECQAENYIPGDATTPKTDTDSVDIYIMKDLAVVFNVYPDDEFEIPYGNTFSLTCEVEGGRDPHYFQLKQTDILDAETVFARLEDNNNYQSSTITDGQHKYTRSVEVEQSVYSNGGEYECKGKIKEVNDVEVTDTKVHTIVIIKHVEITDFQNYSVYWGNSLTITFKVNGGRTPNYIHLQHDNYPNLIKWERFGDQSHCTDESVNVKSCSYTINEIDYTHEGSWNITATNRIFDQEPVGTSEFFNITVYKAMEIQIYPEVATDVVWNVDYTISCIISSGAPIEEVVFTAPSLGDKTWKMNGGSTDGVTCVVYNDMVRHAVDHSYKCSVTYTPTYYTDDMYTCRASYLYLLSTGATQTTTQQSSTNLTTIRDPDVTSVTVTYTDTNTDLTTFDTFFLTCLVAGKPLPDPNMVSWQHSMDEVERQIQLWKFWETTPARYIDDFTLESVFTMEKPNRTFSGDFTCQYGSPAESITITVEIRSLIPVIVGVCVGGFIFLCVFFVLCYYARKKKKRRDAERKTSVNARSFKQSNI